MARRVREFRAGEIGLGRVIADLEGLLGALEAVPAEWEDQFREEWSVLEVEYAVALDRLSALPSATAPDIAAALDEMERLLALRTGPPLG